MKNKLTDLNDHLFTQLERLNDEELTGNKLNDEIARANVIVNVSTQIIANGNLMLKAKIAADTFLNPKSTLPKIMED